MLAQKEYNPKNVVVVYHIKSASTICFDGFCAATLLWSQFGDDATYIPVMYHQDLSLDRFKNKDVFFVDFSFDVDKMDLIYACARSLHVFDHHAPKAGAFVDRPYAVFSTTASGCLLVWQYLHGQEAPPLMLRLIDDGDRVLDILPDVGPFMSALAVEEVTFSRWFELITVLTQDSETYYSFIQRGKTLQTYDSVRVEALAKDAVPITLCGITGLAVNSNKFYSHLVGMRLAKYSKTFGAVFFFRPDGNIEISLRREDPCFNMQKIAATFGGGGHEGAAAFAVSIDKFKELMHPMCRSDMYAQVELATKLFGPVLASTDYSDTAHAADLFLQHMQTEIGSYLADDLEFHITESVGHPSLCTRLRTAAALAMGLSKSVPKLKWYHKLFPYRQKLDLSFDEDSIRDILLESTANGKMNAFLAERLLESVRTTHKSELITSIYYLHVSVTLPGSKLIINHTFEVLK